MNERECGENENVINEGSSQSFTKEEEWSCVRRSTDLVAEMGRMQHNTRLARGVLYNCRKGPKPLFCPLDRLVSQLSTYKNVVELEMWRISAVPLLLDAKPKYTCVPIKGFCPRSVASMSCFGF